ncbi:MAG: DNA primase [Acutalibacteraceae bacterium]
MVLPESFISEIKERNDLTEIASSYVSLKKRGRNMVGLCPFHGEKTPSFNIYSENGSFYCFGCGAGGDVITFIMKIENLDYIEAVKFLAQRAGMEMPDEGSYDNSYANLKKRIYEANRETARFYHSVLYSPEGKEGLNYLKNRGLSEKTITRFGLGFAPNGRFNLVNHLKSKGFKDSEIVSANLAFENRSGRGCSDRFYNRVMFPIIDVRGNVIAFGGRIMTNEKPKYLNTSDTPVFKKSANLFSLNFAKNAGERALILCEGYMDVIAVNQAGFQNAVATLGTALTSEQALLMKRYADEVIICYDSDEAGQKATQRAIEILRKTGIHIRVLNVPKGKDPDEFIKSYGKDGPTAFKKLITESGNDVEYRINKLKTGFDLSTTDSKVAYMKEAVKILASIEDSIERELYISKVSSEIGVQKDTVLNEVSKLSKRKNYTERQGEIRSLQANLSGRDDKINPERKETPRGEKAEELLIGYLNANRDMAQYIISKVPKDSMITAFNKRIYSYFIDKILAGEEPLNTVSSDFSEAEVSRIYYIINSFLKEAATKDALDEYINTILDEKSKLSKDDIANASEETINEYLSKLKDKHKRKGME